MASAPDSAAPAHTTDQAWIETLLGHVKGDWPHLEKIRDPGELDHELDLARIECNTVRLHHPRRRTHGRGDQIRQARRDGAPKSKIDYHRTTPEENQ